jgi:hypothetical protein
VERIYQQGVISVFRKPYNWTHFAQTILSYWAHSEVRLPTEPGDNDTCRRRGTAQSGGLIYYPRSAQPE